MKVEVKKSKSEKEIEFPCLVENMGTIILATGKDCGDGIEGFCISDEQGDYEIGEHDTWYDFDLFEGTVTLSND
jgi:hypothetical protein